MSFLERRPLVSTGAPPARRPIGANTLVYEVRSEDEFRVAIGAIQSINPPQTGPFDPRGFTIIISATFGIRAGFTIPEECSGMTITTSGYFPLVPLVPMENLFTLHAGLVTFDHIFSGAAFINGVTCFAERFVYIPSTAPAFSGYQSIISNNVCATDILLTDELGDAAEILIVKNRALGLSGSHAAQVETSSLAVRIDGNILSADGGGDCIKLTGPGQAFITANYIGGSDITTTGAVAGSLIMGNIMNGGTINSTILDKVGLNVV